MEIDRFTLHSELPQWLTARELARYLGIGQSSAYELAKELPHKRFGRLIRVPRSAVPDPDKEE